MDYENSNDAPAGEDVTSFSKSAAPKRTAGLSLAQRHRQRFSWFIAEAHKQAGNRAMRAKTERYYDSEQIDADVRAEIEARGQVVVVHNEVKSTADWLIGTERRTRVDFTIMPRESMDKDSTKDAEVKTKVLKWLSDVNRTPFERSYAWDDAVKSGLGWIEVGVRGDVADCPIYTTAAPWREILHDSFAQRPDLSDARYIFRVKVIDLDIACAMFPKKKKELYKVRQEGSDLQGFSTWMAGSGNLLDLGLLSGAASDDGGQNAVPTDLFNPRERVLVVECWSIEPNGGDVRPEAPSVYDRAGMSMRCSIMTEADTLIESWSPYKHGRYPFIPVWAYRYKNTGLPYSPIRPLMDKQDALNMAMSKALYEGAVNQTLAEAGAFDAEVMEPEQVHEELQDPNGMAILAAGALQNNRIRIERGTDRAQNQLMLAEQMRMSIREGSSVTDANKGRDTNATSGKAIGLQQDQGSVLSTELFDNALLARQLEGEITLSLTEQFLNKPRVIALSGERKQSQMVEINAPQPDGSVLNDVTARSSQFVIGEQAWRQTLAAAAFEKMIDLMGNLAPVAPQVVISTLDLIFEYADLPNKEAFLERIRAVTGQPGPDGSQSPEQQAAVAAAKQMEEAQRKLQMATLEADLRKLDAEGTKVSIDTVLARVNAMLAAATGAAQLVAAPGAMPIADELLRSAGFEDQNTAGPIIDMAEPEQIVLPEPVMPPGAMPADVQMGAPAAQPGKGAPGAPFSGVPA